MRKSVKKGFTLIELIIVIAILGILAAVLIPKITGVKSKSELGVNRTTAKQIQSACSQYNAEYDVFPNSPASLDKALKAATGKDTNTLTYKSGAKVVANCAADPTTANGYLITFNDDTATDGINEGSGAVTGGGTTPHELTEGVDTNKLWK